ncbi:hypothetical protein D3C71_2038910 [compost metagenome]
MLQCSFCFEQCLPVSGRQPLSGFALAEQRATMEGQNGTEQGAQGNRRPDMDVGEHAFTGDDTQHQRD